jgi:hypothetical protein
MLDKIVMVPVIWHSECDSSGITDFGNSKRIAISTFESELSIYCVLEFDYVFRICLPIIKYNENARMCRISLSNVHFQSITKVFQEDLLEACDLFSLQKTSPSRKRSNLLTAKSIPNNSLRIVEYLVSGPLNDLEDA